MTYSLLVTTLDTRVLNKIQCWAVQAILNKLGVNKSFPHRVAFGPKDLCSMALLDMSVEQGVRGVQHFTDQVFSKDSVGTWLSLHFSPSRLSPEVVLICWRIGSPTSHHAGWLLFETLLARAR
jgi:hypothetical protein